MNARYTVIGQVGRHHMDNSELRDERATHPHRATVAWGTKESLTKIAAVLNAREEEVAEHLGR